MNVVDGDRKYQKSASKLNAVFDEYKQILRKNLQMGLFCKEKDSQYEKKGTETWKNEGSKRRQEQVTGQFCQMTPEGVKNQINFHSDDQAIYFYKQSQLRSLNLCLTVLEENYYLRNRKNVYEIKLKNKNSMTVLYTYDSETFISFYVHLAKHCVLTTFKKHFRICQLLGSGTFAKVYNGLNIFSKESVALKIFQKNKIDNEEDTELIIINEIINLQKLRKFHLSPLIGVYETDDCVILILQKAEAGNMIDYLRMQAGNYNEDLIKAMMKKVIQNLKQLHAAGFIHRDIKPENIFFNNNSLKSSLFLGDFSLTVEKKECDCNLIARKCSGTLGFIAPEVINDNKYDEKCDIFSLGCLFYFLHRGQSLFHGKTNNEICNMTCDKGAIERKIKSLRNLNEKSDDLLRKFLEIDPKKRISAEDALNHEYFEKMDLYKVWTGEEDRTLREYVMTRISKSFK